MKKVIGVVVIALLVLWGVFTLFNNDGRVGEEEEGVDKEETKEDVKMEVDTVGQSYEVIGTSEEGREIQAYRFGEGDSHIVLVGAIHGGYEWNTALLAYELIDYFKENDSELPEDISLTVIPVANPDGLFDVVGHSQRFANEDVPQFDFATEVAFEDPVVQGRFNANGVDLNRNFACNWQSEAQWRSYKIDGGTEAFSEAESRVLRDFFLAEKPDAAIFYHSASNGIYTSFCNGDPLPGTVAILDAYSAASGYQRFDDYTAYPVTGDVADWLSTQGIPAASVELSTHQVIEFDKNLAGVKALFELYSEVE